MLWIGRLVEQLYGRLVLVGAFLVTAILGGIVWSIAGAIGVASPSASLGASGGISGLVGLLLVLGRVQGRDVPVGIARGVRNYALIVIVINALFGFSGFGFGGGAPVNNWVHAGGLAAGALLGLVLPPMRAIGGRDLTVAERVALIAVIAASVAAMVYAAYLLVSPSSGFSVIGP
jgi:membrane associated rhomboid family serine protease